MIDQFWLIFGDKAPHPSAEGMMRLGEPIGNSLMRAAARASNKSLGMPVSTRIRIYRLVKGTPPKECNPIVVFDGSIFEFNGYVTNGDKYSLVVREP